MKFHTPTDAAQAAAKQLHETGVPHVVVKCGEVPMPSGVKVPVWTIMPAGYREVEGDEK